MDNGTKNIGPSKTERSGSVVAAFVVMFAAATVTVEMRVYTRIEVLHGLESEDWLTLAAWVWQFRPGDLLLRCCSQTS